MKFMCKYSGSVYSFEFEHDIKAMLTHPDYVKVDEEEVSLIFTRIVEVYTNGFGRINL